MSFNPRHGGPSDMTPEQINEYDAGFYGESDRKYG